MNPLDRIAQLTEESRQLRRSVDELRAQVETARQELAREAGTIAKLAAAKNEALGAINRLLHADHCICENIGSKADQAMHRVAAIDFAESFLSRHA